MRGGKEAEQKPLRQRASPLRRACARQLPQGGRPWQAGPLSTACLWPDMAQKGGPCYRGQARLRTTSQSASQTAPLVGEPLAKPFTLRGLPKPPLQGATATTAASGGNREELLGQRPAGCERQRSRRWEPQPGLVERSETERLYEGKPDREPPASLPSQSPSVTAPPKGEPLACR